MLAKQPDRGRVVPEFALAYLPELILVHYRRNRLFGGYDAIFRKNQTMLRRDARTAAWALS
jgi:hypothetical protein